jgi:hypothetical protein
VYIRQKSRKLIRKKLITNKIEIIMKKVIFISIVLILSATGYVKAQNNDPCGCWAKYGASNTTSSTSIPDDLEGMYAYASDQEQFVDVRPIRVDTEKLRKCLDNCKSIQKQQISENGVSAGTRYTYKGKSVVFSNGNSGTTSSSGSQVNRQATSGVSSTRGTGNSGRVTNSSQFGGAAKVKVTYPQRRDEFLEKKAAEEEAKEARLRPIIDNSKQNIDINSNTAKGKVDYWRNGGFDNLMSKNTLGDIEKSREGDLTNFSTPTTMSSDLLVGQTQPNKLETTVKWDDWGLFQDNYEVVIFTDNYANYPEESLNQQQNENIPVVVSEVNDNKIDNGNSVFVNNLGNENISTESANNTTIADAPTTHNTTTENDNVAVTEFSKSNKPTNSNIITLGSENVNISQVENAQQVLEQTRDGEFFGMKEVKKGKYQAVHYSDIPKEKWDNLADGEVLYVLVDNEKKVHGSYTKETEANSSASEQNNEAIQNAIQNAMASIPKSDIDTKKINFDDGDAVADMSNALKNMKPTNPTNPNILHVEKIIKKQKPVQQETTPPVLQTQKPEATQPEQPKRILEDENNTSGKTKSTYEKE